MALRAAAGAHHGHHLPGAYQPPTATHQALAEAHSRDFASLRKAAAPILASIEAGHLDLVGEIEARCNAEIAAARAVHVKILPRDEAFQIPDLIRTKINLLPPGISEVRTVEIVGLDLQADGGTHVANTAEVGHIRVVDYKSKGAINKRIYIRIE